MMPLFDLCTARTPHEKNMAAQQGTAPWILFCGGGSLMPGAQAVLETAAQNAPDDAAVLELRTWPQEHPKLYDPITCETPWAVADSMLVRRSAFEAVGGFEEDIFSDVAAVDFSWRLRVAGYRLLYVPAARLAVPEENTEQVDAQCALADQATASLALRLRFGTAADVADWDRLVFEMTGNISTTPDMEQRFCARMAVLNQRKKTDRAFYHTQVERSGFAPVFWGFDAAFLRAGAAFSACEPKGKPRFTVIMRAYQRPDMLLQTLKSLRNQTYQNFCVLVVEDGERPVCKAACETAQQWLQLTYLPLRDNAGRCEAGNAGLRAAQTDYVCFLDDDDYFFAEHLECMAAAIDAHPECRLFFAGSVEGACKQQAVPQFVRLWNNFHVPLTKEDFFAGNPVSIQSAVFHKSLFEEYGGLDPQLDALEDWDFWLRCVIHTPFVAIEKATSLYRVPAQPQAYAERKANFTKYRLAMVPRLATYRAQANLPPEKAEAPQDNAADTAEQPAHLAALRTAAERVCGAKGWRLASPLRAITRGKRPDLFGPQAFDFATADAQSLNRFIFGARTSAVWRMLRRGR